MPIEQTIRENFNTWTQAWNAGDIEGYLVCYAKTEDTTYIGSGKILYGFDAIVNNYRQRFSTPDSMGQLQVQSLKITVIDEHNALIIGVFQYEITHQISNGVFTLHTRKMSDGWRIIVDHSSALS